MLEISEDRIALASRWPVSPFPGLRPFRITASEDESLIFYGRNRAKDEILARLNTSHLVFVVGPSGCGKSSLIKAGVKPALEAGLLRRPGPNWRTAEMRPGESPARNLACSRATFWSESATENNLQDRAYDVLRSDNSGLWLMAETLAPRAQPTPLLILIDQFEEVFDPHVAVKTESKLLLDLLIAFAAKPHPNLFFIVNMRTDFLGHCANFPRLADVINETLFITPVLRDSELKTAIARPPEPYHGMVEEKLTEEMLKDAASEMGYNSDHLPLMQHALAWLWNKQVSAAGLSESPPRPDVDGPSKTITLAREDYIRHGRFNGILNEHGNAILGELSEREQQIAKVVFTRLSERDAENRYRRSPTTAATLEKLAGCESTELERVLSLFSQPSVSFLDCRPLANAAGELIDLSHESLIRQWGKLQEWADKEAEKVREFRDLVTSATQWKRRGHSADYLKTGAELGVWEQWWREQNPSRQWIERYNFDQAEVDLTNEYLVQSRKQQRRKRLKIAAVAACGALALLGIISGPILGELSAATKIVFFGQVSKVARSARGDVVDATIRDIPLHQAILRMRNREDYASKRLQCSFVYCLDLDAYHFFASEVDEAARTNALNAYGRITATHDAQKRPDQKKALCDSVQRDDFALMVEGVLPQRGFRAAAAADSSGRRIWGPVWSDKSDQWRSAIPVAASLTDEDGKFVCMSPDGSMLLLWAPKQRPKLMQVSWVVSDNGIVSASLGKAYAIPLSSMVPDDEEVLLSEQEEFFNKGRESSSDVTYFVRGSVQGFQMPLPPGRSFEIGAPIGVSQAELVNGTPNTKFYPCRAIPPSSAGTESCRVSGLSSAKLPSGGVHVIISIVKIGDSGWWYASISLHPDANTQYVRFAGDLFVPARIVSVGLDKVGDLYLKDEQGHHWRYLISWERMRGALGDTDVAGILSRIGRNKLQETDRKLLERGLSIECQKADCLTWGYK